MFWNEKKLIVFLFFCSLINEIVILFLQMDDVYVTRPIKPNPGVWHNHFNATFMTTVCILMHTTLVIYVAYLYRRTRLPVGIRTVIFHDITDIPYNAEICSICLCDFTVGDRLATIQPCKHVYHQRYGNKKGFAVAKRTSRKNICKE